MLDPKTRVFGKQLGSAWRVFAPRPGAPADRKAQHRRRSARAASSGCDLRRASRAGRRRYGVHRSSSERKYRPESPSRLLAARRPASGTWPTLNGFAVVDEELRAGSPCPLMNAEDADSPMVGIVVDLEHVGLRMTGRVGHHVDGLVRARAFDEVGWIGFVRIRQQPRERSSSSLTPAPVLDEVKQIGMRCPSRRRARTHRAAPGLMRPDSPSSR